MLTVAPLASGQAHYYLSLTASAYYTQAPEPEGSWYGLGAEEFGLKGTVKPDHLTQALRRLRPKRPGTARPKRGPERRPPGEEARRRPLLLRAQECERRLGSRFR